MNYESWKIESETNRQNIDWLGRMERLVDLLQMLLLKIKLTEQPVSQLYPNEIDLIKDDIKDYDKSATALLLNYTFTYCVNQGHIQLPRNSLINCEPCPWPHT